MTILEDLGLEEGETVAGLIESSEEEILSRLEKVIGYLLDKDMEKLLNTLYRIDVNEQLVKEIFSREQPEFLAFTLSKAILDRQKEKIKFRNQFRNSS